MSNRLSNAVWMMVVGVLVVSGCEVQPAPEANVLAVGPDITTLTAPSEQSGTAIDAAGGLNAWINAKKIEFACVTTFYQEDGTYYLTEQSYEVYPWSNSLRILGREPSGDYSWQLQQGRFGVLQGRSRYDGLEVGTDNGCIAEGILNLVTAPVRLLDAGVEFKWSSEAVKVGGQWYRPIKREAAGGAEISVSMRSAGFYQNRSTGRIDMVLLNCGGSESVLIVRGYNYRLLGKEGGMIPSKIEVFKADTTGRVRYRIIQIDVE